MRVLFRHYTLCVLSCIVIIGCRKDELITDEDAVLEFSSDTVYFDTVLVSLGSVTNLFKIYNQYDQPIEIEQIYLATGENSFFRLNVDGVMGDNFKNIRIARKDSIFVFVEVTIDPLNENNPLLIKDSVIFILNNNQQDVKLLAYGQDVVLFNNEIFQTQTWTSGKPYLIVNNAAIDSNEVLTIEPGTHIYLTPNSSLIVWGHIEAFGTLDEPIVFTGARFDGRYEESAGQWGTVFIHQRSTDNIMQHVIIKNATAGMQVGYPDLNSNCSIELRNCMILNSEVAGILTFNGKIDAYNTVIADCGSLAISIEMGGTYNFYHCTISNYSAYYPGFYEGGYKPFHEYPSVIFTNYRKWFDYDNDYRIEEVTYPGDLELNFVNSIINGNKNIEVYFDSLPLADFNYTFDHCLLKLAEDSLHYFDTTKFLSVLLNDSVHFVNDNLSLGDYDFRLDSNSAAIDAGRFEILQGIPQLEFDFNGNPRTLNGLPDLGAYERTE